MQSILVEVGWILLNKIYLFEDFISMTLINCITIHFFYSNWYKTFYPSIVIGFSCNLEKWKCLLQTSNLRKYILTHIQSTRVTSFFRNCSNKCSHLLLLSYLIYKVMPNTAFRSNIASAWKNPEYSRANLTEPCLDHPISLYELRWPAEVTIYKIRYSLIKCE